MLWLEKERTYTPEQQLIIDSVAEKYGLDLFVAGLISERVNFDLNEVDFYLSDTFKPVSPKMLKDMDKAVEIIFEHMKKGNRILQSTDFDMDGTCSGYILINTFKAIGYDKFECYMPHRQKESYGLSTKIVEMAHEKGVKLIITTDNGIAAFEAIDRANELGIDVVVTDHHEVQQEDLGDGKIEYKMPNAKAVVNPHREDCEYPYKMLSGGGVAYKLSQALIMGCSKEIQKRFLTEGYKEKVIAGAAISAVADVMKITGENRALVKEAFKYIDAGVIPAIKAINPNPISIFALSFIISPRLSSQGRLNDMNESLKFLLEEDPNEIARRLEVIESYNNKRIEEEHKGIEMALDIISKYETMPDIIIEYLEGIAPTVLGLVAGKIKERVYRPVIFFSQTPDGDYKGSGRSIDEYDMFGNIAPFLSPENGIVGGGHPAACGLKIIGGLDKMDNLRKYLLDKCTLSDYDKTPKVYVDKFISLDDDLDKLYDSLKVMEPFGTGNTAPKFAIKDALLDIEYKVTKKGKEYASFIISEGKDSDNYINGVCWDQSVYLKNGEKIFDVELADIIVELDRNSYNKKIQLVIKSILYKN